MLTNRRNTYKLSKFPHFDTKLSRLLEIYSNNKELANALWRTIGLFTQKGISNEDVLSLISQKEKLIVVPVSVFNNNLAPLEALSSYLKDALGYNYHQIGLMLNRDERTIWITYRNAKAKQVVLDVSSLLTIPVFLFASTKNSVLEILANYLKEKGYSNHNIAVLIGRNDRTIWTVLSRYKKKNEKE